MLLIEDKKGLASHLSSLPEGSSIGLVPTMGALHQGHISLVKKAMSENDLVVVSIFVNPTQFNDGEDLKKYPKTLDKDRGLLSSISDGIVVFHPPVSEIYEGNVISKTYDFKGLDSVMEGKFRGNHFNGVATIVEELFLLVQPDRAYFGEKDYQQLQIIKKLVEIKKIKTEVIGCPIVREINGLAMSSRNERLSEADRKEAAFIYQALLETKKKFNSESANRVVDWVKNEFKKHPRLKLEYLEIATEDTLRTIIRKKEKKKYRAFIAVYLDDVRLIDNIAL